MAGGTPATLPVFINADGSRVTIVDENKTELAAVMFNPVSKKNELIQLLPMGNTILRQVSLKKNDNQGMRIMVSMVIVELFYS